MGEKKDKTIRTLEPLPYHVGRWTEFGKSVGPPYGAIEMRLQPQRNPQEKAIAKAAEETRGCGFYAGNVGIIDPIPVGVNWVGITTLTGTGPRVEHSGAKEIVLGTEVDDCLADMESALQTHAEPTHLAELLRLGTAKGLVNPLPVPRPEGTIVRDEQGRSPEKGVVGVWKALVEDYEYEPRRLGVIRILNKFSDECASVTRILVRVLEQSLNCPHLIKRATLDASIRTTLYL